MNAWTAAFTFQYERFRQRYPSDPLLVVFDIDGTILDLRYAVIHAMRAYDRDHRTDFFSESDVEDVRTSGGQIDWVNTRCPVSPAELRDFQTYYDRYSRESECILASNVPHRSVLDFMRWFQSQPAAHIALNTARLETYRNETMRDLNVLGRIFGIHFDPHLLQMRPGPQTAVQTAKVAGMRRFKRDGFKVIAVADNDCKNIAAIRKSAGFWDKTLYLESPPVGCVTRTNRRAAIRANNELALPQQAMQRPAGEFVSPVGWFSYFGTLAKVKANGIPSSHPAR